MENCEHCGETIYPDDELVCLGGFSFAHIECDEKEEA